MNDVVAITQIAAGGEGVGRLADGRAVFVARTAPGERIRLREGVKLHKSFARGELAEIVAAGAARVTAPCPHYVQDHCGGCQLQHVTYEAQLAAKRAIVGDALRRIAKLDIADPEIVEAVEEWRYRAKISLAVKGGGVSSIRPAGVGVRPAGLSHRRLQAHGPVARAEAAPGPPAAATDATHAAARPRGPPARHRRVER